MAQQVDREAAGLYVAHTTVGDPAIDAILRELDSLPQEEVHRLIAAGMNEDRDGLKKAPRLLRDFFMDDPPPDPPWLDHEAFGPGITAFQRNANSILAGFVTGVLIDGFATLIAKSFAQTGRIFDNGVWRLKQNNRHMLEIFWPGGLRRQGDGWKLSTRIRFAHGRIRSLLAASEEWDHDAWGVPVSAAHVGYATSCFAARAIKHSESLGGRYTREERASFHDVWRYAGHLMGVPEPMLFRDEDHALSIYRIGSLCEPAPTIDSIVVANALINSAPLVAGIEDPDARSRLVNGVIYPVSRGLIGNRLANELRFPQSKLPFPLFWYRLDQQIQRLKAWRSKGVSNAFGALLEASAYSEGGLSYRLPDHEHAEKSTPW